MKIFLTISSAALVSIVTAFSPSAPWAVAVSSKKVMNQKKSKPVIKEFSYKADPILRGSSSVSNANDDTPLNAMICVLNVPAASFPSD